MSDTFFGPYRGVAGRLKDHFRGTGKIIYRWGFIIVNIEIDEHFIINNDTIQISRRCKREICNKVLSLMHKEEN